MRGRGSKENRLGMTLIYRVHHDGNEISLVATSCLKGVIIRLMRDSKEDGRGIASICFSHFLLLRKISQGGEVLRRVKVVATLTCIVIFSSRVRLRKDIHGRTVENNSGDHI